MKPDQYTLAFIDINGEAGQVKEEFRWRLQQDFLPRYEYYGPHKGKLFSLLRDGSTGDWDVVAHPNLVWDYATGWLDYDKMKEASLIHDILHWLIAIGVIDTAFNDRIDQEFYLALRQFGLPAWRAWFARRGTNTVDQEMIGTDHEIIYLNNGKRVTA